MDKGNEIYNRFLQGDTAALGDLVNLYNERLVLFLFGFGCHMQSILGDLCTAVHV